MRYLAPIAMAVAGAAQCATRTTVRSPALGRRLLERLDVRKRDLIRVAAALAAATLTLSTAAQAAVSYSFASTFFNNSFTVTLPNAVTSQTVVNADTCFQASTPITCQILFDPAGSPPVHFGPYSAVPRPVGADGLLVQFGPGVTYYDEFAIGAFTTNGPHSNTDDSASVTFNVSGIPTVGGAVPEPAGWALMLLGFATLGGALRARRRATTTA